MKGQKIGYIRVSSANQNTARQLDGIEVDRLFVDSASGKNTDRPKFQEMLDYVREGDMIVVHSMDRLARSLKDLVTEVDKLVKRGIAIQFVKENITFTAQSTPMDTLMLQLMGAFAQFEREIILERQKEGIKLAAAQGKYKGRVHKLNTDQIYALKKAWNEKKYSSKMALGKAFGISRQTVYRYLDDQITDENLK
ncbi:recombinase family protein [Acinetobacter baumannii]|uniref:recombinase family protein n=1 Tax=Acinetobacter baumannii TaxID=470 RepID=UPI00244847E0|nr:recombinase family protein [Acinetobacter baumannii]MDH2528298.1 recombinase family protein [Acinetobacter baumannii]